MTAAKGRCLAFQQPRYRRYDLHTLRPEALRGRAFATVSHLECDLCLKKLTRVAKAVKQIMAYRANRNRARLLSRFNYIKGYFKCQKGAVSANAIVG